MAGTRSWQHSSCSPEGRLSCGGQLARWIPTPPKAVLAKVEPNKPLFAGPERQVTFVLHEAQGGIPTFFVFENQNQKVPALGINTLRGTPDERGVEIRFEAVRFRRDEREPDTLWVRAVGIANETEGKTPISLGVLERGQSVDLRFHDEIQVPFVAHVIYDIYMTIRYDPRIPATHAHQHLGQHSLEDAGIRCL